MTTRQRHIAHLHLHAALSEDQYDDVIELVSGVTPHVQAIPPNAVQLDLTSALRYFDLSPYDLVQMAKLRLKGLYDIDSSAGLAGNRMLAAMAADASAPGDTTWVPSGQAAAWLYPRPVTALPGIGRATAATLDKYGLHTIGQVADVPAATLQRLLGVGPARLLAERAQGRDPRPVTPLAPARHLLADLVLDRDCLDPALHHRAVLGLADRIGQRLRGERQVTGRLHPHGAVRRPHLHHAYASAAGTHQSFARPRRGRPGPAGLSRAATGTGPCLRDPRRRSGAVAPLTVSSPWTPATTAPTPPKRPRTGPAAASVQEPCTPPFWLRDPGSGIRDVSGES